MKFKHKFSILGLILLVLLSISVVSASENITEVTTDGQNEGLTTLENQSDEVIGLDDQSEVENNTYNAKIIVKDYSSYYDNDKELIVQVKDIDGNIIGDVCVKAKFYSKSIDYSFTESNGKCSFFVYEKVGTHKATISLEDSRYNAKPISINIKITKAPTYLTVKKITTTSGKYFNLKATVKDKWGSKIDEGTVKFTINGKTYSVKVKNGVATKKVKLDCVGTRTYKAVFSSNNYKTKTAYQKVVVKKSSASNLKSVTLAVNKPNDYFATKKVNGDEIWTVYANKDGQYKKGVYAEAHHGGMDAAIHTKLVKAKVWFKNKNTGKIITKSSSDVYKGFMIKVNLVKDYVPYKAQVWYKYK